MTRNRRRVRPMPGLMIAALVALAAQPLPAVEWEGDALKGNIGEHAFNFGEYHALLIAITDYAHERKLAGPAKDVDAVRAMLRKFGFKDKNIATLRNAQATEQGILKELARYAPDGDKALKRGSEDLTTPRDNLLVYYAGHGQAHKTDKSKGFWIPYDGGLANKSTEADWIRFDTVLEHLERIEARHVLLVSDSCFSGGYARSGAGTVAWKNDDPTLKALAERPSIQILTSGDRAVADVYKKGNSHFATALLEALRKVPENKPYTPLRQLFPAIQDFVSKETSGKQIPNQKNIGEGGDFVFVQPSARATAETTRDYSLDEFIPYTYQRDVRRLKETVTVAGRKVPLYAVRGKDESPMIWVGDTTARDSDGGGLPFRRFLIDRDEVTVKRFRAFLDDRGGSLKGLRYWNEENYNGDDQPVVGVPLELARAFAQWAGKDLPTRDHWMAAAAWDGKETARKHPWGDEAPKLELRASPPPVGQRKRDRSYWGVRGLGLGVRELCAEWQKGWITVVKGGTELRASRRERLVVSLDWERKVSDPSTVRRNVGFRCIKRLSWK